MPEKYYDKSENLQKTFATQDTKDQFYWGELRPVIISLTDEYEYLLETLSQPKDEQPQSEEIKEVGSTIVPKIPEFKLLMVHESITNVLLMCFENLQTIMTPYVNINFTFCKRICKECLQKQLLISLSIPVNIYDIPSMVRRAF